MPTSYTKKNIEVQIILGQGDFGGGNTKTINGGGNRQIGLPVSVDVNKPGPPDKNSARVSIEGLPQSDYEELTTLSFLALQSQKNLISIRAGDLGGIMSVVFEGEISHAAAEFNTAPDVSIDIEAISGFYPQRLSSSPTSINGEAQVPNLIEGWAGEIGYAYINEGVTGSVNNAIFSGSPLDKIQRAAKHVGAELLIDDNTIISLPAGGSRQGSVPLLSKDAGMIGYPVLNSDGILLRTLYRPDIELGGLVQVESIVPKATGTWKVTHLTHSLSAFTPGASVWESTLEGQYVK